MTLRLPESPHRKLACFVHSLGLSFGFFAEAKYPVLCSLVMVDLNRLYTMGTRSKEIFIIQLLSFAVSKLPQIGHCPDALESHQSFFQCTVVSYSKSILIAARCQLVRRLVMISPDAVFDLVPLEIENTSVQRPVSSMDGRPLQC
ncbi:uncharacterized protein BO96DRAFT_431023 [Aspergillus niger CBS 101883]|uniref:Uncharacterized protein n=2 Tax=Aspergillus niger TaxID=5061 RepID=A2R276_ASPNC|nr:uncharacterized protein BO96DRAFT_431023 [Aspergillus niger CBS 101883]XP_059602198.1 hypothetical protein An13g03840 [Aspergillus niger]PYH59919.1 hypothetical protein BO96DRAFT_431023 [Aspergillus niger CBS 101883]CAK41776.1 hypothetical protein An13g03840 [Aspergillus niger]